MKRLRTSTAAVAAVSLLAMGLVAGCGSKDRDEVDASHVPQLRQQAREASSGTAKVVQPTGPRSHFVTQRTTGDDGTKIVKTRWHGKKSGFTGDIWSWVPPQYDQPQYAKSAFPVLIALPGSYGYPDNYWIGGDFKLEEKIAEWSQSGKTLPFILVMPVLNPKKKYHDGSDIPGQPKMGTWLTEDVPAFARANYRTYDSRDGWAFMGSSSGGFAGLKAVLKHPKKFKAAIANGPDTVPDSPMWNGHPAEKRSNDPRWLAEQLKTRGGPDVYLAFELGSKEEAVPYVKKFIREHTGGPIHHTLFEIPDGKHSGHTYIQRMPESLHWISEQMLGPVPMETRSKS
ncbi:esterase [Streptomyces chrestomyceticus JCM 4735]|uniref:Esterase n=1 Tax=Streptomyces chrestomyceticus JCM 4735 TaxID=1306181 RepID=A0A7U9L3U3_9ACTN|nr:alpha/beta hydrolase-fold protein [Streptomyces chrestomyceticus]GCD39723.1 esterase [Streptomyces chrestomyceticus JCM 4735]